MRTYKIIGGFTMKTVKQIFVGGIKYSLIQNVSNINKNIISWTISIETDIFEFPEKACFTDVTISKDFAEELLNRLADGYVTPFSADEVIENYLVEYA